MIPANRPLPPSELLTRIGVDPSSSVEEQIEHFERLGYGMYRDILSVTPSAPGMVKMLDFGCGSGRVMRWFLQHDSISLTGCDIHTPTIEWMRTAYPSDVRLCVNDPMPPLPEADRSFDVVYCGSVFSHLPDWAPWLLELRRVLKPGGVLVASIHGRGLWPVGVAGSRGVPWDEDRTGLLVERYGDDFETGWGPAVYVSEWWLREHWGRAMEIVRFEPSGFGHGESRAGGQAWVVARKGSDDGITSTQLIEPGRDPRELDAALRAQWLAYEEIGNLHTVELKRVLDELARAKAALGAG